MFKITNKKNDVRKFRDSYTGKDVFVQPKKSVVVVKAIEESEVFKVEEIKENKKVVKINDIEKIEEKEKLNTKEVKQDDSSSS